MSTSELSSIGSPFLLVLLFLERPLASSDVVSTSAALIIPLRSENS